MRGGRAVLAVVLVSAALCACAQKVDVVYGSCPSELTRKPTDPRIFPVGSFTSTCRGCSYQEQKRKLYCEDCLVDESKPDGPTRRSWLDVPPPSKECYVVNRRGALVCERVPEDRRAEVEAVLRERAQEEEEAQRLREYKKSIKRGQSGITDKAVLTGKKPARDDDIVNDYKVEL